MQTRVSECGPPFDVSLPPRIAVTDDAAAAPMRRI
jgi:hypothetical protein